MPRFGCRRCGTPLPAVQSGENLRVRCTHGGCGTINLIPADPNLSPWEARGESLVAGHEDERGVVMVHQPALPRPRRSGHKRLLALSCGFVVAGVLALPPVQRQIEISWAIHVLRNSRDPMKLQRWCQTLRELGPAAGRAAPDVWALHEKRLDEGKMLPDIYLAGVLDAINPVFTSEVAHTFSQAALDEATHQVEADNARTLQMLSKINARTPVKELIGALSFPDVRVHRAAEAELGHRGALAAPAVPQLRHMLTETYEGSKTAIADALGEIGQPAAPAVPELMELLNQPLTAERQAAARALRQIAPRDPRVIEALASAPHAPAKDATRP